EKGIIAVNPTGNSIDKLLTDVINQVAANADTKNIFISYKTTNYTCNFDYKWTAEALYNILDNAVKYTNENGKIKVAVAAYELFYRLDIMDNGIGIARDEQYKVFTRFYRSTAVIAQEGVGIGLYLAREIIERQGGYIKVQSDLGKGTTFSVFLPK
ncbi:MAG: sensor histidine kinase, partial [Desulfitobacteriaceae bacterium]|nr:sensor histidine kinase [Desulfitobacteriaceae bacterium]